MFQCVDVSIVGSPFLLSFWQDRYKAMLLERDEHEQEECLERDVPCTWVDIKNNNTRCMAVVKAKALREHRKEHLATLGVMRYRTPGSHAFTVRT